MAKYHIGSTGLMTIEQAEQWLNNVCENKGLELVCVSVALGTVYYYFKENKEKDGIQKWINPNLGEKI